MTYLTDLTMTQSNRSGTKEVKQKAVEGKLKALFGKFTAIKRKLKALVGEFTALEGGTQRI